MASKWARDLAGTALVFLSSLAATWVFRHAERRTVAPFLFLVVLALIARWFGTLPAFLGTLISAAVFARLLFAPIGSMQVVDADARQSLIWMLLGGCVISDFIPAISRAKQRP